MNVGLTLALAALTSINDIIISKKNNNYFFQYGNPYQMSAQIPLAYSPYLQTGLISPLVDTGVVSHPPAPAQTPHTGAQQIVKRNEVSVKHPAAQCQI